MVLKIIQRIQTLAEKDHVYFNTHTHRILDKVLPTTRSDKLMA